MSRPALDLSLYLVTDSSLAQKAGHDLVDVVRQATANGVTAVQIREKDAAARDFLDIVLRVSNAVPAHVAVIVNDRVDVFLAARAAGVSVAGIHIGQTDLPARAVREMIGGHAILGLSASTEEELALAASDSARVDYVGIGAVHPTATKSDAPPALGIDGFAGLVSVSALPAVAIGGVRRGDLPSLRAAGAAGVAVVSAICAAPDPGAAARELRAVWEAAK